MKQIYNFEQHTPPVLNENLLQAELEKRMLLKQAFLLAFISILLQFCIILSVLPAAEIYPLLFVICLLYVFTAVTGSIAIAFVYTQKGEMLL